MIALLGHIVLLQVVWWTTILGGVHLPDYPWVIGLWIPVFFLLYKKGVYSNIDLRAAFVLLGIGLVLDTIWIYLGWIDYIVSWPFPWTCPLWLCILWFTVGFDFRHSLLWVERNPIIGGIITGLSGPSSYWAGAALGIARIPEETAVWFAAGLFVTWAVLFPLFAKYLFPKPAQTLS